MSISNELILSAIQEGIALAPQIYAQNLESRLAFDVELNNADGDINNIFEEQVTDMILPFLEIDFETGEVQFNEEELLENFVEGVIEEETSLKKKASTVAGNLGKSAGNLFKSAGNLGKKALSTRAGKIGAGVAAGGLLGAGLHYGAPALTKMFKGQPQPEPGTLEKAGQAIHGAGKWIATKAGEAGQYVGEKAHQAAQFVGQHAQAAKEWAMQHPLAAAGIALGTAAAGAGLYALYKHLNSPEKIRKAIEKTKNQLKVAQATKDQERIVKLNKKLEILEAKLKAMQAKAAGK